MMPETVKLFCAPRVCALAKDLGQATIDMWEEFAVSSGGDVEDTPACYHCMCDDD